jgi:hypothetical protein
MNDIPPLPPPIEIQRQREDAIRWAIERLTNRTHDLKTVGARAFVWKHALAREGQRGKLLSLAEKLKVSSARASQAVADAQGAILKVRTINIASCVD